MVLAIIFGLYMTRGIGASDVANAMGTSVGSGAITVKQAIIIAAIFDFCRVIYCRQLGNFARTDILHTEGYVYLNTMQILKPDVGPA